jgi:hypothetical protein
VSNIKRIADLKDYDEILKNIKVGQPAFLEKDGHVSYAILDIVEYANMQTVASEVKKI